MASEMQTDFVVPNEEVAVQEELSQEDLDEDNKPKTSLNELKNFRIQRKRENEEKGVDDRRLTGPPNKQPTLENAENEIKSIITEPPNKQPTLENTETEIKSIIEVHIDNLDINKRVLVSDLMTIADLKEEALIQLQDSTMEMLQDAKLQIVHELTSNKKISDSSLLKNSDQMMEVINADGMQAKTSSTQAFVASNNKRKPNDYSSRNLSIHFDEGSNNSQNEEELFDHLEKLTPEEELKDAIYRKSCNPFLQHLPCFKLQTKIANPSEIEAPDASISQPTKIHKCRECRRRTPQQGSNDVYCRFYEFRCLQYTEDGQLLVAGFPNPYTDPTQEEINIWKPDENTEPTAGNIDIQVCRYILLHVGDQFCYLWRQEAEALKLHENANSTIAWKKVVQGIREICDVCDTTLFNFHWTCDKCGFGVCLDCFKDRKEGTPVRKIQPGEKPQKGRDECYWLLCSGGVIHHMKDLMLTQIIAGDALNVLGRLLHDVRRLWQIPQLCGCLLSQQELPNGELKSLIQDMIKESQLKQQTSDSSLATEETLRKQSRLEQIHSKALEFARSNGIDYVPGRTHNKQTLGKDPITSAFDNFKHINFLRKGLAGLRRFLPPRAMILTHSSLIAPGVPHEWLCDGKLLRLTNANHPDNRILFQEVWKCGQPVMISEVAESLNLDLWRPDAFLKDFGDKPNDLINCLNGNLVPNQPMRHFWEGFQCMKKRLLDANGKPMLLKLKDWPPGDDFAEILPTRYMDLMRGLPMPEYTLRTGNLNIASCLPKMFVPPDLGPKMYNAYGSAFHPDKGTTNLHLDISDAVNIMVYVGIPEDSDSKSQISASHKAIAMGGCEFLTRARVQNKNVVPGALWHIFPARDADKIRDLLNRVTLEKGYRLEPDHDPIHDQNWYLDDKLRARLFKEYGVEGYPIVQCLGDAVFIPAGAPHQVQNLHNCIKVAEDFVSPENITHCFHLTHEFRRLSHSHTNHEDKLQIKNIIYHAIKDCCTILTRSLENRLDQEISQAEEMKRTIQNRADNIADFA
ncbi:lysine demethylase 3 [Haematobia irritans]|uniref:lysine demethylase 3 n=1 Tax=Haematobia irritans TaxID=7368 RepID=UPI003F50A145